MVAGGGERVVGARRARGDEPARRRLAQRAQAHDLGRRLGHDLREQRPRDVVAARAPGDDDRDRQVWEPRGEVHDEAERQLVGPVRVVDHERERRALGEVRGEPVEAVQERVRRALVRAGRAGLRLEPEQLGGQGGAALQQPPALGGVRGAHARLEELARDAEGELALELPAARGEHLEPALLGAGAGGREQRRLPEPGRRLDEHQPSVPGGGGAQRRFDDLDLGIPLEQFAQDSLPGQNPSALPRCAEGPRPDTVLQEW